MGIDRFIDTCSSFGVPRIFNERFLPILEQPIFEAESGIRSLMQATHLIYAYVIGVDERRKRRVRRVIEGDSHNAGSSFESRSERIFKEKLATRLRDMYSFSGMPQMSKTYRVVLVSQYRMARPVGYSDWISYSSSSIRVFSIAPALLLQLVSSAWSKNDDSI